MITYPVNELRPIIRDMGRLAGVPMIRIGLQGCNMRCPWCNAKHTWPLGSSSQVLDIRDAMFDNHKYFMAKPKHLARVAANLTECVNWILITGGEPTLYPLDPLVDELHNRHCMVALETNGTSMRYHTANIDWLTVSPKLSVEGPPVLLEVVATADELIFVITCEQDIQRVIDYLNTFTDMFILGQVCLQPADNNSELTVLCTDAVIRCNWRLSIQTMQLLKERSSE